MKKSKRKTNNNLKIIIALLLIVVIICIAGYFIYKKLQPTGPFYAIESRISEAENTKIADATTIGWIKVQGTNIDYPMIYETAKAYNSGEDYIWIPHVANETENRMAIYGHNIRNVSSEPLIADPTLERFEQLMSFVDYDFAKNNQYIQLTVNGEETLYKIYAVSFVSYQDDYGQNTNNLEEAQNYIDKVKSESLYKYDVDVKNTDTLISLITCTRYFGNDGKKQFKIDARKVNDDEKIEKSKVTKTSNYDIIK